MDIEADNAPRLEGCGIGVTDSSPIGVMGELTGPEGCYFVSPLLLIVCGMEYCPNTCTIFHEN